MNTFLGIVTGFIIALSMVSTVHASSFFDDLSGLSYSFSDGYSLRDYSAEYNRAQPDVLQAERYLLIGPEVQTREEGLFEVSIGESSLNSVLDELRLRIINTEKLSNRDILGTTAIEMIGTEYATSDPRRALVFIFSGKTIVIFYKGSDLNEYEAFLRNLSQPTGMLDSATHPFSIEINDVVERKIFAGYQNSKNGQREFGPDKLINRAEFLKVIVLAAPGVTQEMVDSFWRNFKPSLLQDDELALSDGDPSTTPLFADVDRDAWFAPYIFFAFEREWVDGYPDGTFRPTDAIIIAEAPKMILNSRSTFLAPDLQVWFRPFLDYLDGKNVMIAEGDQYRFPFVQHSFFAHDQVTRAQAAALLSRLLWLDDHDQLRQFGREVTRSFFPFTLELVPEAVIYELDRPVFDPASATTYHLYLPEGEGVNFLVEIGTFSPEAWTLRERSSEQTGSLATYLYLGEDRQAVYVSRIQCVGPQACVPQQERLKLLQSFQLVAQNLSKFSDQNARLSFLYADPLNADVQRESTVTSLELTRNDGWVLAQLSIIADSLDAAALYQGQSPERIRRFGNRDWYGYPTERGEEKELRLVTDFGVNTILVAVVPGILSLDQLDGKVQRILRTIGR